MDKPFKLNELGNTYVDADSRYVVSFMVGYSDTEADSPKEAVAHALDLTQDEESHHTHWYVYDRVTQILHLVEQGDVESYCCFP